MTIQWMSIRETNCAMHWIEIYPVDSIIHLLNNCGQVQCKWMFQQWDIVTADRQEKPKRSDNTYLNTWNLLISFRLLAEPAHNNCIHVWEIQPVEDNKILYIKLATLQLKHDGCSPRADQVLVLTLSFQSQRAGPCYRTPLGGQLSKRDIPYWPQRCPSEGVVCITKRQES